MYKIQVYGPGDMRPFIEAIVDKIEDDDKDIKLFYNNTLMCTIHDYHYYHAFQVMWSDYAQIWIPLNE